MPFFAIPCRVPADFRLILPVLLVSILTAPTHSFGAIAPDIPHSVSRHQLQGVESLHLISPGKWHTKISVDSLMVSGPEQRVAHTRVTPSLGFGLAPRLELHLGVPVGATFSTFDTNGSRGVGIGDVRLGMLVPLKQAQRGGLGVSIGTVGFVPAGANQRLMGEGDFSALGFVAVCLTSFSSSIIVNLGYHARPGQMITLRNGRPFRHDDDLFWRLALRIPKDEDIAWSLMVRGAVGVTNQRWRKQNQRPVWLGGGVDFPAGPAGSEQRIGLHFSVMLNSDNQGLLAGVQWSVVARDRDEDRDGIFLRDDECPLLREDKDGFQDEDGCPDMDNDQDTFPDTEDACPLTKASPFSMDGC